VKILLAILAVVSGGNGLWMLLAPAGWYTGVPAAVPDFGPLNVHFVRDIGAAYLASAVGLTIAAIRPEIRVPLVGVVAVFFVLHAVCHVFDTAGGVVSASHWLIDFPGVHLPALALVAILVVETRRAA
jgi:hypothetical protein